MEPKTDHTNPKNCGADLIQFSRMVAFGGACLELSIPIDLHTTHGCLKNDIVLTLHLIWLGSAKKAWIPVLVIVERLWIKVEASRRRHNAKR